MHRSHKIRLYPNKAQHTFLKQCCGVARFVYNWTLSTRIKQYERGKKPTYYSVKKLFNRIKRKAFPFVMDVSKSISEYSAQDCDRAYKNFFNKQSKFPRFKKRKHNIGSFSLANDICKLDGNKIKIPKIGWIKMAESLRFTGKILKYTISSKGDKWFVSISVEVPNIHLSDSQASVGIDLGIKDHITLSDERKFKLPDTKQLDRRIKRLQKDLSRKQKGSSNWKKNLTKLQNAWYHRSCKVTDYLHKITTEICTTFGTVAVEDLNVKGMMANHKLARAIANSNFHTTKQMLEYKSNTFLKVGRFFPSSKTCNCCGFVNNDLSLSDREWQCPNCHSVLDRDVNAAKNIIAEAIGKLTPVDNDSSNTIKNNAIGSVKNVDEAGTLISCVQV